MTERKEKWKPGQLACKTPRLFREYLVEELRELLWTERKLVNLFPKLETQYAGTWVGNLLNRAFEVAHHHAAGIGHEFDALGVKRSSMKCEAMNALLKTLGNRASEQDLIKDHGKQLVSILKQVNRYKITAYHALVQLGRTLGLIEIVTASERMLAEEQQLETALAQVAD